MIGDLPTCTHTYMVHTRLKWGSGSENPSMPLIVKAFYASQKALTATHHRKAYAKTLNPSERIVAP